MSNLSHLVFTSAQIRAIEKSHAKDHDGHCFDLMEEAGKSVFNNIKSHCPLFHDVWVFAGSGNNGGDGYIVAALLLDAGISHRVFALNKPHPGSEAATAYEYFLSLGGKVEHDLPDINEGRPDVIVDALLGTGIKSAPRSPIDEWILFINRTKAYTVAVDVPSGVNADTGTVEGDCVKADLTVCMLALKPGLLTGDAVDYTGEVTVESLGVDVSVYHGKLADLDEEVHLPLLRRSYEDIIDDLPHREKTANKGDCGKVLIIGGAKGMGGAARICAQGALRAGAGLVKVATDSVNINALNAGLPEAMTVDFNDEEAMAKALAWADVIAIGPGLSQDDKAHKLLESALSFDGTVVLDADALNLIASGDFSLSDKIIMTPHPGEAARLLGLTPDEVNYDRIKSAVMLQRKFGGIALLKGAGSVICDGKRITIVQEGSPSMASGGMGDLLTGIIAAFLGQDLTPKQATVAAACVHGRAGELSGRDGGIIGTLATDLTSYVRALVNGRN